MSSPPGSSTTRRWRTGSASMRSSRRPSATVHGSRRRSPTTPTDAESWSSRSSIKVRSPAASTSSSEVTESETSRGRSTRHTAGSGVATRAVRLLIDYAFRQLGLVRVQADVEVGNLAFAAYGWPRRAAARGCCPQPGDDGRSPARLRSAGSAQLRPGTELGGRLSGCAQRGSADQARDHPGPDPQRGRSRPAVRAHLQARVGPARRGRRPVGVAGTGADPGDPRGARLDAAEPRAAAGQLAAALAGLGRRLPVRLRPRGAPGVARRRRSCSSRGRSEASTGARPRPQPPG